MMGTCTGCSAENVELNEAGHCATCAAAQGNSSTETPTETTEGTM